MLMMMQFVVDSRMVVVVVVAAAAVVGVVSGRVSSLSGGSCSTARFNQASRRGYGNVAPQTQKSGILLIKRLKLGLFL